MHCWYAKILSVSDYLYPFSKKNVNFCYSNKIIRKVLVGELVSAIVRLLMKLDVEQLFLVTSVRANLVTRFFFDIIVLTNL